MTYITNTLTDSNAPATLYAAMATALTTEGFTLVDTNVISTRTHKIWKCAAASNPANVDWYLDIAYTTTGAGTLGLYPMEFYDPATDLAYRAPFFGSSNTAAESTYYSRNGASGFTLESANLAIYAGATTGSASANRDLSIPATTFGYWCSISPKRVALFTSNSPALTLYAGLFEPHADFAAQAGALMYPVISAKYSGVQSQGTLGEVSLTRYPKDLSSQRWDSRVDSSALPILQGVGMFPSIPSGVTTLSTVRRAVRIPVIAYTGGGGQAGLFGYLYDVLGASTTAVRGDTVTVGGASYVFASPSSSASLLMKAA